jgi:hypothetical protein
MVLKKQLDSRSYTYTGMDNPVGLQEVGASRIQDSRHMEVIKWPLLGTGRLYSPRDIPGRLRLKCDGTRAEIRFRLSAKWTSPFKSAGASVQSTTGSRGVRISGSNARYTKFRGSVNGTGYPLHSPISPSPLLPA